MGYKKALNSNNDVYDPDEEYFKKKDDSYNFESEDYFPLETSKPPHY